LALALAIDRLGFGCWFRADELAGAWSDANLVNRAKTDRLVIVDELGWERFAGIVQEVVGCRYDDDLPTVVTSGLTREKFVERYGDAMERKITDVGNGGVIDLWQRALPVRTEGADIDELEKSYSEQNLAKPKLDCDRKPMIPCPGDDWAEFSDELFPKACALAGGDPARVIKTFCRIFANIEHSEGEWRGLLNTWLGDRQRKHRIKLEDARRAAEDADEQTGVRRVDPSSQVNPGPGAVAKLVEGLCGNA